MPDARRDQCSGQCSTHHELFSAISSPEGDVPYGQLWLTTSEWKIRNLSSTRRSVRGTRTTSRVTDELYQLGSMTTHSSTNNSGRIYHIAITNYIVYGRRNCSASSSIFIDRRGHKLFAMGQREEIVAEKSQQGNTISHQLMHTPMLAIENHTDENESHATPRVQDLDGNRRGQANCEETQESDDHPQRRSSQHLQWMLHEHKIPCIPQQRSPLP
mmetsp:Transcript_52552/g.139992  ORF Transcript_52552/g.139992 Transcript_52552/m.139992 type:complete len:215 (+) Transcript_52552:126-770(+)